MIEKLFEIIKYGSESVYSDFKSQEYPLGKDEKKYEFLKDISSMANHPSNEPKYILIGVKEKNGVASEFIDVSTPTDQAKYQQFVEDNIEPKINFEYKSFEYEGHKLAAFIISNNQERPYLFKKDIQNITHTREFKIGDGFIRTGTSTKKLSRQDFEEIYKKRYESKDRKSDLIITPTLTKYDSPEIDGISSFFIVDFSIENLSSKSIGFEAELKMFYKEGVCFLKKFDLEDKINEKGLESIYPQHFTPKVDSTMFHLEIEEQPDSYKVSRVKRTSEKHAVTIPQRDCDKSIFLDEILVASLARKCGNCIILLELTLRSDDFRAGPLIEKHELDLKSKMNDA